MYKAFKFLFVTVMFAIASSLFGNTHALVDDG